MRGGRRVAGPGGRVCFWQRNGGQRNGPETEAELLFDQSGEGDVLVIEVDPVEALEWESGEEAL